MKIAIVTPYADPEKGAAVVRVNSFRNYFRENGHEVFVLAPSRSGIKKSLSVKRYNNKRHLIREISKLHPDVVIGTSTSLFDIFLTLIYCRIKKIRFVLDSKEPFTHTVSSLGLVKTNSMKFRIYRFMEKFVYKKSSFVFMLTEYDRKYVETLYKIKGRISVIPNGTDTKIIRNDRTEGLRIRKKLNIKENTPLAIYFGSFTDEEVDVMIARIADEMKKSNIHLLLVLTFSRKDEHYERLMRIVKENSLEKNIHFFYNIDFNEMYKYISAADASLLPWPEKLVFSLPVKVFDSLASEKPVIAKGPTEGPLKDFFDKYDAGYYSTNWEDFSRNLKNINRKKELKEKGKRGREVIEKYFTREKSNKKVLEILEGLVEK